MFTYTDPREALGDIATPPYVAEFLHKILEHLKPAVVLDPSCGIGNLIRPWAKESWTWGVEKNTILLAQAIKPHGPLDHGILAHFEHIKRSDLHVPDLVLCNAPWNRHWKGLNYPEVFLQKIIELFGPQVPICFLCPMGFRLNQSKGSARAQWLSESNAPKIMSIISCPRDMYDKTQFHSEIILFNIPKVEPHYWMSEEENYDK